MTQDVTEIKQEVSDKIGSNQGTDNSGKYLGIDEAGNVVPMDPPEEFNIHSLSAKASIAESDEFAVYGVNVTSHRKITWSTIKSTLKTYFDTLYATITHKHKVEDIEDISTSYAALSHKHKVEDMEDFPTIPSAAYQAEEVVVGSWFGADLYRRVFQIEALETEAGSYNYSHGIEGIDLITKIDGFIIADGVTTYFSNVSASLTDIFYTLDTAAASGTGYLVIEYTKQIVEEGSGENDVV